MRSGFRDALPAPSADQETRESRLICCAPSRDRSMPPAAQMGLTVKLAKSKHSLGPAPENPTRSHCSGTGEIPSAECLISHLRLFPGWPTPRWLPRSLLRSEWCRVLGVMGYWLPGLKGFEH